MHNLPFPRVIRIEPASLCNLKCSHCPTGTIKLERGIMDITTFQIVIENIKKNIDFIKVAVMYHGGEPLINKDLSMMISEVKDIGIPFVKTVSNGMFLNEKSTEALVKSGLDSIEISIDATSSEISDFVRKNSNSKKIMENIKRFISIKDELKLSTPEVFIATTQFKDKASTFVEAQVPKYLLDEFRDLYKEKKLNFISTYAMLWPHMEVDTSIYDVFCIKESKGANDTCDHLNNTMTIRWNGDIVPCCYDLTSRYVIGNIHSEKLSEIWNNARHKAIRDGILNKKFIGPCKSCNMVLPGNYISLKEEVIRRVTG